MHSVPKERFLCLFESKAEYYELWLVLFRLCSQSSTVSFAKLRHFALYSNFDFGWLWFFFVTKIKWRLGYCYLYFWISCIYVYGTVSGTSSLFLLCIYLCEESVTMAKGSLAAKIILLGRKTEGNDHHVWESLFVFRLVTISEAGCWITPISRPPLNVNKSRFERIDGELYFLWIRIRTRLFSYAFNLI
jgi:hypothetical protein